MLDHSRFDNDGPFLTAAQHAGFAPPPNDSLEPPLHRRMLALSTPLPHGDGAGMWDDIVPALPSLDQLTSDWEWLMLQYIHHITDTPLPGPATPAPRPSSEMIVEPSLEAPAVPVSPLPADSPLQVPLFMPEQDSPTSPSPPPPSPTLPPVKPMPRAFTSPLGIPKIDLYCNLFLIVLSRYTYPFILVPPYCLLLYPAGLHV
ncbi:hypothetical protein C8R41DRAFT_922797 [Lentinula lateritia]|uniref:Uncharacterized protein n=1 Tax=Lentinula lateritia TaxID=40482 RepID=A0ABQ8V9S3_9AGAR|nr:hypothetical protein C8R41DRAFT_922797 [Lentinula lateritia]